MYFLIQPSHVSNNEAVSQVFLKDKQGLRWRFIYLGVLHFILLPFMLLFMIIHFFLENAQQFHANKAYLGPRQWSPLALWTFREFNELPHVFDHRINKSIPATDTYISLFHNPYVAVLARCGSYLTGALVATLFVLSIFDEAILLYVHFLDHNLLWYLGIFSALYAASRTVIPNDVQQVQHNAEQLVDSISSYTHYYPKHWENNCHSTKVFLEMQELYPYKVHVFAMELMSVILTPLVLCFSLPDNVPAILDFIR